MSRPKCTGEFFLYVKHPALETVKSLPNAMRVPYTTVSPYVDPLHFSASKYP
jgi:hypothetical protein